AFLKRHPGDNDDNFNTFQSDWISADSVIHVFRQERPGQLRGVPRTTPSLQNFAVLRRYVLATVSAAEKAANVAGILSTEQAGDTTEALEPFDFINIPRDSLLTLPDGTKLSQLKAEHPISIFDEFVKAMLREICRCMGVPAVLALGDASSYNYASGRLDLQQFQRQMEVERALLIERNLLDRVLELWLDEALLIPNFLPRMFASNLHYFEWAWRWAQPGHVDRAKEANGQKQELENNTTTLSREYARQGLDWETELRQRARELQVMRDLGLSQAQAAPAPSTEETEEEEDETETSAPAQD
ncbi:MAG: phage portal protein, partial [Planctomycetota bacterium]